MVLRTSSLCRQGRNIVGELSEELNLPDVARADIIISKDNYLTLLVHLGIASVEERRGEGHTFRPTSRYVRSQFFLGEMVRVALLPLFECVTR